jgi:hypothetical protein
MQTSDLALHYLEIEFAWRHRSEQFDSWGSMAYLGSRAALRKKQVAFPVWPALKIPNQILY